ncbi:hypothetical protein PV327_004535 [Microctonus hyperodae]|uniref:Uncharacterized protein n=1 Tax=Microctonus hyperodae TaxID=165561 RepID=A0AA39FCL9_MICHY|nr:hypothetical protein PV327_004535 [Microctonus hyperodae]
MSDLIDLASPDSKKVSGPKLSSPLIPLPANDPDGAAEPTSSSSEYQPQSIDNNPFDMELQKINEFISKSEDPFEVVWQKAHNIGDTQSKSVGLYNKTSCTNSEDDSCYKSKRHSDVLKMNKTLDDSLITTISSVISRSEENKSVINEKCLMASNSSIYQLNKLLDRTKLYTKGKKTRSHEDLSLLSSNPTCPDLHNLSILSQSVINDDFLLCSPARNLTVDKTFNLFPSMNLSNCKESANQLDSSILNQSAMNDSLLGSNNADNCLIKSIVAHRIATCIQKGIIDAETEVNIPNGKFNRLHRSYSQGDQLSNINVKKLDSHSTVGQSNDKIPNEYSIPSILYEDPFNKAFMSGTDSEKTTISNISAISSIKRINSVASGFSSNDTSSIKNRGFIADSSLSTQNSLKCPESNKNTHRSTPSSLAEISDLVEQYDLLKARTFNNSLNIQSPLIRLDVENSVERNNIQQHNITSDSVFLESNSLKQSSILADEQLLAKTFEKCSFKSRESDSSGECSLPKRPPSTMELLTDLDSNSSDNNNSTVGNLIELQTSNSNNDQTESMDNKNKSDSNINNKNGENAKTEDIVKEFEKELFEPDKKLTAATLLMELEKLVKNEKNPKAIELLENLENVLGVKCSSNVELLEMCVEKSNKNTKSITTKNNPLPIVESTIPDVHTIEKDNLNIDSTDNGKQLSSGNFDINNGSMINKSEKLSKINDDNEILHNEPTETASKLQTSQSQNSFNTQKLVIDVQLALQKLLINNNSDPIVFLENLNKVLNPLANETNSSHINASAMAKTSTLSLNNSEPSNFSNKSSIMRRSVNSTSTLRKSTVLQRRSSTSQITSASNERNIKIKTRIDSPKKTVPRRSSNDHESSDDVKLTKKMALDPLKLKPSVPLATKNKLRRNNDATETATKKGPLKALIPLGSMQRRKSIGKKVTPIIMPPATPSFTISNVPSTVFGATSTPLPDASINLDSLKNSPKRKPVASSTPDINIKVSRAKIPVPRSPKQNTSWNISPVTPNAPKTAILNNKSMNKIDSVRRFQQINKNLLPMPKSKSRSSSINLDRTPEDLKKNLSQSHGQLLTQSDGKTKHGRRSEPVKNTITAAVTGLFQRTGKQIVTSNPLKENNTPGKKVKPINLISKFQRRSGSTNTMEKENKWK